MKINAKYILIPFLCLLGVPAGAQSVAFLETVPDARGAAMGGVGTATAADAWSVYWNAAKAVTASSRMAVDYSYSPWMKDFIDDSRLQRVGAYYRLDKKQAIVAGFRHIANGKFEIFSDNGESLGTVNPREYAFEAGYARSLFAGFSAAATIRYIRSDMGNLQGADAADAVAFDISCYYQKMMKLGRKEAIWSAGLQVADLGNRIKYDKSEYALPARLNAGTALTVHLSKHHVLTGAADLNYRMLPSESTTVSGSVGIEYGLWDILYLRSGYHWGDMEKSCGDYIGWGAGLHYKYATMGFAWRSAVESGDPLDKTMTFTLGFNF